MCSCFAGGVPTLPVYIGELQAPCLGTDLQSWDAEGKPVVDEVGELVVTNPMPSMPIRFWNDPGGVRYRESYFEMFPGVWRHGDWITLTSRGTVVIHGRSDSTLNRQGVRMGSADIYEVVERLPEIKRVPGHRHRTARRRLLDAAVRPARRRRRRSTTTLRDRIRGPSAPSSPRATCRTRSSRSRACRTP